MKKIVIKVKAKRNKAGGLEPDFENDNFFELTNSTTIDYDGDVAIITAFADENKDKDLKNIKDYLKEKKIKIEKEEVIEEAK